MSGSHPKPNHKPRSYGQKEIEYAKRAIGRFVWAGEAANAVAKKYKVCPEVAAEIVAAARRQVVEELNNREEGTDLGTLVSLSLLEIISHPRSSPSMRVAANSQLIRLLTAKAIAEAPASTEVENYLADLVEKRRQREADNSSPPSEAKQ